MPFKKFIDFCCRALGVRRCSSMSHEAGVAMVEYAVMLMLIATVAAVGAANIGTRSNVVFARGVVGFTGGDNSDPGCSGGQGETCEEDEDDEDAPPPLLRD
jgi:hypothetical protein